MSNDIRTRRLIVTMPDVTGEEADTLATDIASMCDEHVVGQFATVVHALDESPVLNITASAEGRKVTLDSGTVQRRRTIQPDDARKLAALLLRAADEAEDGDPR